MQYSLLFLIAALCHVNSGSESITYQKECQAHYASCLKDKKAHGIKDILDCMEKRK